jgi:hypothetical protein
MTAGVALSAAQLEEIKAARARGARVRRAIRYARFDAWMVAGFACLTALGGLSDPAALLLGTGMAVVAAVEFRATARLRQLDPAAARVLGLNQLAFALILAAYAAWNIHATLTGPGTLAAMSAGQPAVADMLRPYEDLTRRLMLAAYGALITVAVVMQGGTAWFYFSRGKHVEAYLRATPGWILELQRAGVMIG